MVHPNFTPAIISDAHIGTEQSFTGKPARFLPQMVHTPDEEEDMRARGYLNPGEPPAQVHHAEYPKFLRHARYAPAVKETKRSVVAKNKDTGENEISIVDVPARPEQFPDKIVESPDEEKLWRAEGWEPAGTWDTEAFEHAHAVPDTAYVAQEWPKWVPTGEVDDEGRPIARLMEDPDAMSSAEKDRLANEYPKMVNGQEVKSEAEELVWRNRGALLTDSVAIEPVAAPDVPPSVAAPQPVLDVAALKTEILSTLKAELVPEIGYIIREVLAPKEVMPHLAESAKPRDNATPRVKARGKREYTAEERKAIGARFKAGREAARKRREAALPGSCDLPDGDPNLLR